MPVICHSKQLHNFLPTNCLAIVFKVNWPAHYLYVTYVYFSPHSSEDFVTDRKCVYCVVRPRVCVRCIKARPCRAVPCRAVPRAVSRLLLANKMTLSPVTVSTPQLHMSDIGERRTQEYSHCYRNSHPRTLCLTYIAPIPDNFQTRL
jgi:hypothetical protein